VTADSTMYAELNPTQARMLDILLSERCETKRMTQLGWLVARNLVPRAAVLRALHHIAVRELSNAVTKAEHDTARSPGDQA